MSDSSKSQKIKQTIERNRLRRASMVVKVFELKIDESHLSKDKLEKLKNWFHQAKWLYNYLIGNDSCFDFDYKIKEVPVKIFNKETRICDLEELRTLTLSSQIKQSLVDRTKQNIINLSKKKSKGGRVGKLKFVKEVNSIPLKQANVTYKIKDKNKIAIQGLGILKVNGLEQVKGLELANAVLLKKPSGFFVKITVYGEKESVVTNGGSIGLDFGIKDSVVMSNGEKFKFCIPMNQNLRRQQKFLSRKTRGSKRYLKQLKRVKKLHERNSCVKNDLANKFVNKLKKYEKVVIQDENLAGWSSSFFGKTVQNSILGRIKSKIKMLETSIVVNRFLPTTKISPISGKLISIPLSQRIFQEGNFLEDRDVKSAKTILALGLYNPNLTRKELMGLPEEERISIFQKFYTFEEQILPMSREATAL